MQADRIPFQERNSPLRGVLDLATGRYPRFLFGGGTGPHLPVFHFHEAHPPTLEFYFRHLAENGYHTITSEALAAFVRQGRHPGPRTIMLCFDDAWASLWVVVAPLLAQYDLQAVAYVIPRRVRNLPGCRPQWQPGTPAPLPPPDLDRTEPMFATWNELRALQASGRVDLQAHSWSHAMIPVSDRILDSVHPDLRLHPHNIPMTETPDGPRFLTGRDLGAPITACRSRLSDARRWIAPAAVAAGIAHVQARGGAAYFTTRDWRPELLAAIRAAPPGRPETEQEQHSAITAELVNGREQMEAELGNRVRHLCFPWAIAGRTALALAPAAGYVTAFADRLGGRRAPRAGDPPFQLMRLKHQLIPCLPGRGRRWFFSASPPAASGTTPLPIPPLPTTTETHT